MLGSLKQDSIIYILDKTSIPKLTIGKVKSVSSPTPKYPSKNPINYLNGVEMVVDIEAYTDTESFNLTGLSANSTVDNNGKGIIVSESRDAINSEVEALLDNSRNIVDSIDFHKEVIASCEAMLPMLNPQVAKEKQQEEKINNLEGKICGIENTLVDMKDLLTQLTNKQ